MTDRKVRVRFAPSPTGALHIGGVRTALYNYLFARQHGGELVFRIEDTDSHRFVPGAEEYILESFKWLGIQFDEGVSFGGEHGPYRQSERRDIYKKYVQQLLDNGKAYIAFDTPEELEAKRAEIQNFQYDAHTRMQMRNSLTLSKEEVDQLIADGKQYTVRFKIEPGQEIHVNDMIRGDVKVMSDILDDKVLYKSADELPTYHLANIVDDHLMEISHVIRGDDHIANTPKQLMVYEALGWEAPEFGHMTLIINSETGKKLSKRDTNTLQFIEDYRKKGYMPEAVFNFIALLGWNPGGEDEIFSREELIKLFDEHRLSKSPAAFDQKKMDWMSNEYIKNADFDTIFAMAKPFLEEAGRLTDKAEKLVELYKPQMKSVDEIIPLTDLFFEDFPELTDAEKEFMAGETVPTVLEAFKAKLEAMSDEDFKSENIFPQIKAVQKETGIKGKNLFMPIRIAVSGEMHGPELPDTIYLLGREKSIEHIDNMLKNLK